MTQSGPKFERRMLVVHETPLVAEDLREMLMSAGAIEVELAPMLPEAPPSRPFDTCFLSVSSKALSEPGLFEGMTRVAAHVVLIMGFLHAKPDLPPHFSILSEPFRDEDVLAALQTAWADGSVA